MHRNVVSATNGISSADLKRNPYRPGNRGQWQFQCTKQRMYQQQTLSGISCGCSNRHRYGGHYGGGNSGCMIQTHKAKVEKRTADEKMLASLMKLLPVNMRPEAEVQIVQVSAASAATGKKRVLASVGNQGKKKKRKKSGGTSSTGVIDLT